MFFNLNEWTMNAPMDMMFNVRTYKTIRKRVWHDNSAPDNSNDFLYFSFHELNAAQAVAFLFSSQEDVQTVHPQSVNNKHSFDIVDYAMWNELNLDFQNGIDRYDSGYSDYEQ